MNFNREFEVRVSRVSEKKIRGRESVRGAGNSSDWPITPSGVESLELTSTLPTADFRIYEIT